MAEKTPVQVHFDDVNTLFGAGAPLTPEELAISTGGDALDFTGVHLVQASPELTQMARDRDARLIRMAGMDAEGDGPIGAALLAKDIERGLRWLFGKS